jgi:purine-binding chemotaxis protein CheW
MSKNKKILVFKIGNEEFAADIMQVERILGYVEPKKVPEAHSFVKGVIKYQESILPVIDLNKRLKLEDINLREDAKIIVVKHNDRSIGLIVDMVSEVIDVLDESIEEAPEIVKGISNKYIMGMVKLNDRIIILLDTEKILTIEQMNEIGLLAR